MAIKAPDSTAGELLSWFRQEMAGRLGVDVTAISVDVRVSAPEAKNLAPETIRSDERNDGLFESIRTIELGGSLRARPPTFLPAPGRFDGRFDQFWDQHVEPNLPHPEMVAHYHRLLRSHLESDDPLFLVRAVSDIERRATYSTDGGFRLRATDNAPSWYLHSLMRAGLLIEIKDAADLLDLVPCHMFDVMRLPTLSHAGFHVAHLLPAKNRDVDWRHWDRSELTRRCVRNLHPCNTFPIAKPDWQHHGGRPDLIGFAAARYRDRYGPVWQEFLSLAGAEDFVDTPITEMPDYRYPGAAARARPSESVADGSIRATWSAPRLRFYRDRIEPLAMDDQFCVTVTGEGGGDYIMTKSEFYEHFSNVAQSASYRQAGYYHYTQVPERASRFRRTTETV